MSREWGAPAIPDRHLQPALEQLRGRRDEQRNGRGFGHGPAILHDPACTSPMSSCRGIGW